MAHQRARDEFGSGTDRSSNWWSGGRSGGSATLSTSAVCGDFVRSSLLLRHVCEPDVGAMEEGGLGDEGSVLGNCACQGALAPATLNTEVQDLWWQEVHWVFAFSPTAAGGTFVIRRKHMITRRSAPSR